MISARCTRQRPGEGHHVRLFLAPPGQSRRPLAGPAHLVHLLARHDHAAIHESRRDRRQLSGRDRDHCFVQQGETLLHLPVLDQHVALSVCRQREQVRVAEPLADLGGLGGCRGRRCEVTRRLVLEHDGHQEVATLRALATVVLEQPLSTAEPAARAAHLSSERQVDTDPDRTSRSTLGLLRVDVELMSPLQVAHPLVVAAEHVGRRRQELEVLRGEWSRFVGARERLVGLQPRPRCKGPAALVERARVLRRARLGFSPGLSGGHGRHSTCGRSEPTASESPGLVRRR